MGRVTVVAVLVLAGAPPACRERAQAVQDEAGLRDMVRRMMPIVAQAAGRSFKREPTVRRRSRHQVRDYVIHKLEEDLPKAQLTGLQTAMRLFGLFPDTTDLRELLVDIYTEQIAGYYDPDSGALFIPEDIEPFRLRVVISHELVHALQDQYVSLDSIMSQRGRNDRRAAAQAILEGQATVDQLPVLMPEQRIDTLPLGWFWRQRVVAERQQEQMRHFARAPLWVRDGLIFPYLGGADFVLWFRRTHPGRSVLTGMPVSTEQILHPDRYAAGDAPTQLRFADPTPDNVRYEDDLGEFETRLLLRHHLGNEEQATRLATGWDGDRYRVLGADERGERASTAHALVWYSVWDDAGAADRFAAGLVRAWNGRRTGGGGGRRHDISRVTIGSRPGVRLVDAPAGWSGWRNLPQVKVLE